MDRNKSTPALGPKHDAFSRIQKAENAGDRMAALKARVAAAIGSSKAKGGLNVGLHPALEDMGSWKPPNKKREPRDGSSAMQAETSQIRNGLEARKAQRGVVVNPYTSDSSASQAPGQKQRQPRQLIFNQKGKYIQQANALRRQAALEAMKKRIAEQTRKAGIDDDLDVEKGFVVEEPPSIEWWDEALVTTDSYNDIDTPSNLRLSTPDSIVTELIQHPVSLEPPQDRQTPQAKAMFLTSREQAKLRRQRRMAELKEMQAKIRLGLVPAPPPKVKKGNLMRVLGDVAVKDPTAVEAQVNREIANRHQSHVDTNEERKLTKEQRLDKLTENQQKDAEKGIYLLVFKVLSLANGQHRFKIGKNAEQYALTGICILHPKFNLVIVEGGEHSIGKYRKLMLNRIDWTENAASRDRDGKASLMRDWLLAEDERGELKDMSLNRCDLVFEGEQKTRMFRKWGSKVCETDAEAREALARAKMDNFWSLAKAYNGS